jgi:SAM-dependent methyltransferase
MVHHKFETIIANTISHYDQNAADFYAGTKDHDVSQNIQALLSAVAKVASPPFKILDFGSGPGRDLIRFKELGHEPTGLDGSLEFCKMSKNLVDAPILHQRFDQLDLPELFFDGIFANASLFHIPRAILPQALSALNRALKPRGVLFCSNPRGDGESIHGGRFGNYMELVVFQEFLKAAHFELVDHYYRPTHLPIVQRPWLATVSVKQK